MAGFQFPQQGQVLVGDKVVGGPGADRGVVFRTMALMPWLNAEDNVAFGLRLQNVRRNDRLETARRMLDPRRLKGFAHHAVHEMSGGMRQRVGLARAWRG